VKRLCFKSNNCWVTDHFCGSHVWRRREGGHPLPARSDIHSPISGLCACAIGG